MTPATGSACRFRVGQPSLQPRMIVVENVAPFLRSPAWAEMRCRLLRLGYEVDALTLNAVDFGVPQRRRRSFTFASRVGLPEVPLQVGRP